MEFDFFNLAVWTLVLIAVIVIGTLRKKAQKDSANDLGLSPVGDTSSLEGKIFRLYTQDKQKDLRLRHVFKRPISDGELFLFDLVDKTYDDATVIETRAIAITSPDLNLPHFVLAPKKSSGNLSNALLSWNVSNQGALIAFPEFPEFNERFLVASTDDPARTRGFFDANLIRYFLSSQPAQIHAGGTMLVVSLPVSSSDPNALNLKIDRAKEIFRRLRK